MDGTRARYALEMDGGGWSELARVGEALRKTAERAACFTATGSGARPGPASAWPRKLVDFEAAGLRRGSLELTAPRLAAARERFPESDLDDTAIDLAALAIANMGRFDQAVLKAASELAKAGVRWRLKALDPVRQSIDPPAPPVRNHRAARRDRLRQARVLVGGGLRLPAAREARGSGRGVPARLVGQGRHRDRLFTRRRRANGRGRRRRAGAGASRSARLPTNDGGSGNASTRTSGRGRCPGSPRTTSRGPVRRCWRCTPS